MNPQRKSSLNGRKRPLFFFTAVLGLLLASLALGQITYEERAVAVARGTLPPGDEGIVDGLLEFCSLLPALTPDGPFPRYSPEQLQSSSFPDHMHAFYWPGWSPPVDHDGSPYGPGSLCSGDAVIPREGLIAEEGHTRYGQFEMFFNEGYGQCKLMKFIELCEVGRIRCRDLLELERDGLLRIVNPDKTEDYQAQSGLGVWRTYKLMGDSCLVEPVPVLMARTLIGHTAVELVTRWILHGSVGEQLPPWLEHGLANYLADMGAHLVNFMAEFRVAEEVLITPAEVDAILSAPPAADAHVDRQQHRQALYGAFLLVWRLIEDNGGLPMMRQFLAAVAQGQTPDAASEAVYGENITALAARLDPVQHGDPLERVSKIAPFGSRPSHLSPGRIREAAARKRAEEQGIEYVPPAQP
ncbi:MAG: hypothetical protein ABIF77_19795, partial [bacterium]